jgi:hypothetical protein
MREIALTNSNQNRDGTFWRCGDLVLPDNISLLFLPPYGPDCRGFRPTDFPSG